MSGQHRAPRGTPTGVDALASPTSPRQDTSEDDALASLCRDCGHPIGYCHCGLPPHVLSWFAGYQASLHEGVPGGHPALCRCGQHQCRTRQLINLMYRATGA